MGDKKISTWFSISVIFFALSYLSNLHVITLPSILVALLCVVAFFNMICAIWLLVKIPEKEKNSRRQIVTTVITILGVFFYAGTLILILNMVGYTPCIVQHFTCSKVDGYYNCEIILKCSHKLVTVRENVSNIEELENMHCFYLRNSTICS